MKTWTISILIAVTLFSCCKPDHEQQVKQVLGNVAKRYPELYKPGEIESYKLVREFYNNDDSIKMELFDKHNSWNEIVVLSNNHGKIVAIPFPDNDYRSYWRFYGEKTGESKSAKNFNSEMMNAYKLFSIKQSGEAEWLFNDLMFSLLQAEPFFAKDSLNKKNSPKDYPDSCFTIAKNNNKDLSDGFGESSWWMFLNTFYDHRHARYLQFYYFSYNGNMDFKITAYREPCFVKPLFL
jgi:hypothetical protein